MILASGQPQKGKSGTRATMVLLSVLASHATGHSAFADEPLVETVTVQQVNNFWRFDVTLSHPDTGWDHYADGWRILDMEGNELALRVLTHPHIEEQPFMRSLGRVQVPDGITQVQVQARCLVDGWGHRTFVVTLP